MESTVATDLRRIPGVGGLAEGEKAGAEDFLEGSGDDDAFNSPAGFVALFELKSGAFFVELFVLAILSGRGLILGFEEGVVEESFRPTVWVAGLS